MMAAIFFYSTLFRQKSLVKLLKSVRERLPVKDVVFVSQMSFMMTLLCIGFIVLLFIYNTDDFECLPSSEWTHVRSIGFAFNCSVYPRAHSATCLVSVLPALQEIWAFMSPILYCIVLSSLLCMWQRDLKRLGSSFVFISYHELLDCLDEIREQAKEFERLFSIQPLLWLIFILVRTSLILATAMYSLDYAKKYWILPSSLAYVFSLVTTITIAIFYISYVKNRLNGEKVLLAKLLARKRPSTENLTVLHEMDSVFRSLDFTVWYLTPVSTSLLLSYIGSVLSFSLLVAQIQIQFDKPYNETQKFL